MKQAKSKRILILYITCAISACFAPPVTPANKDVFTSNKEILNDEKNVYATTEIQPCSILLDEGTNKNTSELELHPVKANTIKKNEIITFMTHGGWCWYQDPRAIISNGKIVIGGLDGMSGDVNIGVFDLKTERAVGQTCLHKALQADDHNAPALYARPDGSILAVWAKHGNEKHHYYAISSPDDYLKWENRMEHHHVYNDKRGVTYMNLYYMKDEALLYNFYRDGETFNPSFITSSDHGKTWGHRTHFVANDVEGRQRPYVRYAQVNESTVGISYTDAHPRDYGNSLYYVAYKNKAFYKVDGTKIKDLSEGPLHTSEGEKIYIGSETKTKPQGFESVPNSAWSCAAATDADGHPHQGYTVYLNDQDHRFRIASWDGKKWNDREVAYAGKCLYTRESSYTGLMAFDPTDPTKVYISSDVNPGTGEDQGGMHEIYSATIGPDDDMTTIEWKAITINSKHRNIRPIVVAGDGYKVLLWLNGPWDTYVRYNVDVPGIILERPNE